jgi:hypothetical protein
VIEIKSIICIGIICILFVSVVFAIGNSCSENTNGHPTPFVGTLNPIWNKTWDWGDANSVVADDNNLYLAGIWHYSAVVLKYNKDGNLIWNRTWGNNSVFDCAYSIAIKGNYIYVVGFCDGQLPGNLENTVEMSASSSGDGIKGYSSSPAESYRASSADVLILKYDLDGNLIWHKTWGGTDGDYAYSVAVDSTNTYIVGFTYSYSSVGEIFILKYDFDGNMIWDRTLSGSNREAAYSVAVDSTNIYIAGGEYGFVLKYDKNGNFIWKKTWGSNLNDCANSIALDSTNIYVAGVINYSHAIILQYDTNGNLTWNTTWGGSSGSEAKAITIDSTNIYVAGQSGSQLFVLKYDLNGSIIWEKIWGRSYSDIAYSITVDSTNIYIAGSSADKSLILKTDLDGSGGVVPEFQFVIYPLIVAVVAVLIVLSVTKRYNKRIEK